MLNFYAICVLMVLADLVYRKLVHGEKQSPTGSAVKILLAPVYLLLAVVRSVRLSSIKVNVKRVPVKPKQKKRSKKKKSTK